MFERLFCLIARLTNNKHNHSYADQTVSFTLRIPVVLSYKAIDACVTEEQLRDLLLNAIKKEIK